MSTSFPGALDALTNPAATDGLTGHAAQHANANDAIEALEAKVGVDNSTDPASLDYRVATLESGGGGGIWGSITGALSDQTDLQAALNWKLSASATTDAIAEGATNQYFTSARVRAVVLAGLSTATNAVITAADSVLTAFGKLQKQISDNLTTLTTHTGSTSNPHSVTKTQVGLGSCDNTADLDKPVSTATQAALALKANLVSPTFTTPDIGVATGTSFNSITGLSSTTPAMDGTAAVGTGVTVARADHVHPTDTTRAPLNSPTFTGTVSAPSNFNATGAALKLQTGGTDRITIDAATGAVGIGNVSGGAKVESYSSASLNMRLVKTVVVGNDGPLLSFANYNNSAGISDVAAIQSSLQSGTPGQEAADLTFLTKPSSSGNIERLRITSAGAVLVTSPNGLGYGTGAGGTVTQATSKATTVTLNKPSGRITMNAASLAAGASVFFQLNNSLFSYSSGDSLIVESNIPAGYIVKSGGGGEGFTYIVVKNDTGNPLADAVVLTFKLLKGATS